MSEEIFSPKDERTVIDQVGQFGVLIMFAWENGEKIPTAARIDVSNADRSQFFTVKEIRDPWESYEEAVVKTKAYARKFADDLSGMKSR